MSAPSIPNLLSLRGSRGGASQPRGRGRGRFPPPSSHATTTTTTTAAAAATHETTIQGTDSDAAVSRLSAVDLGYLQDPYARYFVSSAGARRLPIINRGVYIGPVRWRSC